MSENQKPQNSYKKLLNNTIIFAIGTFSSKVLVFLLMPLYTSVLSTSEFGAVDNLVMLANLLMPLVAFSISDAIIRYVLDKDYNNKTVFTVATLVVFFGTGISAILVPLLAKTSFVKGYGVFLFIYMITASTKLNFGEFVRASEKVKLYAIDGILTTASMIIYNIFFLLVLKLGTTGYFLAIILSDATSIVFLFFTAKIYKQFSLKSFDKTVAKEMLIFAVPLIPAQIMWWVTNVSDRFLVRYFLGDDANGIYSFAYKIPIIVSTVYLMFSRAWNLSAITEHDSKDKNEFYSNVFNSNLSIVYVIAASLLLGLTPIINFMATKPEFRQAYKYIPVLIIATCFSCLCTFFSSIYSAAKLTKHSAYTLLVGAVLNVFYNIILIPVIGPNGASIATFVSYFVVFVLRVLDINTFMKIKINYKKLVINTAVLGIMAVVIVFSVKYKYVVLSVCFIIVFASNLKVLIRTAKKVLPDRIVAKLPF